MSKTKPKTEAPSKEILAKNKWKKGMSGNPGGRPKGSKNKTTLLRRAIEADIVENMGEDVQSVALKAFDLAKAGDPAMIKLIWETFMSKARMEEKSDKPGFGGINITIGAIEQPPAIEAEIIEDTDNKTVEDEDNYEDD